jgi:hypothetical protein
MASSDKRKFTVELVRADSHDPEKMEVWAKVDVKKAHGSLQEAIAQFATDLSAGTALPSLKRFKGKDDVSLVILSPDGYMEGIQVNVGKCRIDLHHESVFFDIIIGEV